MMKMEDWRAWHDSNVRQLLRRRIGMPSKAMYLYHFQPVRSPVKWTGNASL